MTGNFSLGVRGSGLRLVSDNSSQPTATSFMKDIATLGIEQIFTSYDNPKGNADTERMMRTIKEEVVGSMSLVPLMKRRRLSITG